MTRKNQTKILTVSAVCMQRSCSWQFYSKVNFGWTYAEWIAAAYTTKETLEICKWQLEIVRYKNKWIQEVTKESLEKAKTKQWNRYRNS